MSLISTFFIIIFFIKSTTTFYLSIFLSFLIIFIINFKNFTKKIIVFSSVLLFFSLVFISDNQCTSKIKPIFNVVYNDLLSTLNLKKIENQNEKPSNLQPRINDQDVIIRDMSSSVLVKSYEISMLSLFDKPFGWGWNNFKKCKYVL